MINVGIIGAAGLSGLELIQILRRHPGVKLTHVTSDKYAGRAVGEVFPQFNRLPLVFARHDAPLNGCDLAFLAVPNKASLELAGGLLERGVRVVDLSGVFRLRDTEVFKKHYGMEHTAPEALAEAVFGLPEAFREDISAARLIANPGCYPTGALLGLLPLAELAGGLAGRPIIDANSGVSGAGGRVEEDAYTFMQVNENFTAYKAFAHQHTPEIEQVLAELLPYDPARHGAVIFTPHLLPLGRGILSTIYLSFADAVDPADMRRRYAAFAEAEPFVLLLPEDGTADLKMTQHNNDCAISLHHDESGKHWIVITAIDNLIKGAAGQAVQNMNLMFGQEETTALV
ncbi:MAG: N-acetyl-gamma-glutamyl-phosphate reductase [SAR324 cluster bacterium]|nr:N-acetyl-gamma-glutamyl-phosphate reductase [SAR324 cluster bacterium]